MIRSHPWLRTQWSPGSRSGGSRRSLGRAGGTGAGAGAGRSGAVTPYAPEAFLQLFVLKFFWMKIDFKKFTNY